MLTIHLFCQFWMFCQFFLVTSLTCLALTGLLWYNARPGDALAEPQGPKLDNGRWNAWRLDGRRAVGGEPCQETWMQ